MRSLLVILLLAAGLNVSAQDEHPKPKPDTYLHFGPDVQAYPTGAIFGLHVYTLRLKTERFGCGVLLKGGYNLVRHRGLGVHDDERGGGFGFAVAYHIKYQFKKLPTNQGFLLRVKNDLWWNAIDWKDNIGQANEQSGTTHILVVQPTIELGYIFLFPKWSLTPTVAVGREFNTKQRGADVGQGAILLLGLSFSGRALVEHKNP